MSGLRVYLWIIGLMELVRPPTASPENWARVYCGCKPGPTRVALHPGRMVEVPERQPYVRWTTTYYDFEEMRNMDLSPHTPPRPARGYDLVDFGITSTSRH